MTFFLYLVYSYKVMHYTEHCGINMINLYTYNIVYACIAPHVFHPFFKDFSRLLF